MVIETYNRYANRFTEHVQKQLVEKDVKLIISLHPYVQLSETSKCNGYFDEEEKELAVAFGRPFEESLATLVHEFGHFTQWTNQTPNWVAYSKCNMTDEFLDEWVEGKVRNTKINKEKINIARKMEIECEKIALGLIKKFSIPLDQKTYTKQANAYGCFYRYIAKHRKWYKIGKEPYNNEEILKLMPNEITDLPMNKELEKLFERCV